MIKLRIKYGEICLVELTGILMENERFRILVKSTIILVDNILSESPWLNLIII